MNYTKLSKNRRVQVRDKNETCTPANQRAFYNGPLMTIYKLLTFYSTAITILLSELSPDLLH